MKKFIFKMKWFFKARRVCSGFCPICKHFSVCVNDKLSWE